MLRNKQKPISTLIVETQKLFHSFRILTLLSVSFFFFIDVTFSQTSESEYGKIAGKVVDSETGETIIGANVVISGTSQGDATDIDGRYSIKNIQPGIYSIAVSYISYTKKTLTGIEVDAGETVTVNIQLNPETLGLDEVVVSAQAATNSEAGLLSLQRKSLAVQDGLSSEFLGKTGDGNIAAAMRRVTGVSLIGDNDVYVRGLGNRYSNIQLNGSQVPSTSPNKKEAPIDLVGSGLVDNVVVQKTYSPDQSGEFSGGSVQITTREFPDQKNFTLSYTTTYNSVSTFDNIPTYAGSSTDFLGFDDGKRDLPVIIASQRLTPGEIEGQVAAQFHDDWNIDNSGRKSIPSQKISINYADQFNEENFPIGLVSNFSYKYERTAEPNKTLREIQSASDIGTALLRSDYTSNVGVEKAKLSGMLNFFAKPNATTKIGLKNLYSNSVNNSAHIITGNFVNAPAATRQTILDFDRRAIFSSTLEFDKAFPDFFDSRLKANIGFSQAIQDRPDRRTTQYNQGSNSDVFNIFFDDGGNTHYFAKQDEKSYSAELKYEFEPLKILKVKIGSAGRIKDRDFNARRFRYTNFSGGYPNDIRSEEPVVTLNSDLVADGIIDLSETSTPRDSYLGTQNLIAGYLSTIWYPGKNLTWEIGARIENSDQEVETIDNGSSGLIANLESTDLLPATNVTYSLSDKTNVRGAFSFTLARPEFREISAFSFQDFIGGQIVYGNPRLNRTKIQNYDLRFETYPSPGELFAISAFYKQFEDPIELFYRFTERSEVEYKNGDEAILYGVELEGRKNITDRFQVVANSSIIFSETRVTDPQNVNRVANTERPMYGQSPYTVNLATFYQFPNSNLDVSLVYNTFGKRVVTVGKTNHPDDEYEQPFHNLGFNASYNYQSAKFSLSIENLLLDEREYKQGDITTFEYAPGMTVEMGVSLSF